MSGAANGRAGRRARRIPGTALGAEARRPFLGRMRRELRLNRPELAFLKASSVNSFDAAFAVLEASRQLDEDGGDVRRAELLAALRPLISDRYRQALAAGLEPPRVTAGALAPLPRAGLPIGRPRDWPAEGKEESLAEAAPVDLLGPLAAAWLPQEQGTSQACVAYASAACLEWQRARRGDPLEFLSPMFLQAATAAMPLADPAGFRKFAHMRDALARDGVCRDALWSAASLAGAAPDAACRADAGDHLAKGFYWDLPPPQPRPKGVARAVYELLAHGGPGGTGSPVAIAVPQFRPPGRGVDVNNWTLFSALSRGEVQDPPPGWVRAGGHAVVVLGFQPAPGEASGGWFIIRNSWGTLFGGDMPALFEDGGPQVPAAGYGAITARYVDEHCWEIFAPLLA